MIAGLLRIIKEAVESSTYGNSALKTLIDAVKVDTNNAINNAGYGLSAWLQPRVGWVLNKLDTNERATGKIFPSLGNAVSIAGAAGVWAQGAWVEIVPAAGIAAGYTVRSVTVEAIAGVHQLELGRGGAGAEVGIGSLRVAGTGRFTLTTPLVAGGSRLAARTASLAGGAQAIDIAVGYAETAGAES